MIIIKISEFIYSWLKDLVILFAIISLIDLIMPKGNMKKYINFVIGLLIIFTVINPFVNFGKLNFDLDKEVLENLENMDMNNKESINGDFILKEQESQIEEVYKEKISQEINKIAKDDNNYEIYKININIDQSEENYGNIKSLDIVLYENSEKNNKNNKENIDIKINQIDFKEPRKKKNIDGEFSQFKNLISKKLDIDIENINIYTRG